MDGARHPSSMPSPAATLSHILAIIYHPGCRWWPDAAGWPQAQGGSSQPRPCFCQHGRGASLALPVVVPATCALLQLCSPDEPRLLGPQTRSPRAVLPRPSPSSFVTLWWQLAALLSGGTTTAVASGEWQPLPARPALHRRALWAAVEAAAVMKPLPRDSLPAQLRRPGPLLCVVARGGAKA